MDTPGPKPRRETLGDLHALSDDELNRLLEDLTRERADAWRPLIESRERLVRLVDDLPQLPVDKLGDHPVFEYHMQLMQWRAKFDAQLNELRHLSWEFRTYNLDEDIERVRWEIESREPQPDSDVVSVLSDLAVSLAGAGAYDATRALISRNKAKRHEEKRSYTEEQLSEFAQRALAQRLSIPFGDLALRSIETGSQRDAVANFVTTSEEKYRVTIEMTEGIAVITRLQHEVKRDPFGF